MCEARPLSLDIYAAFQRLGAGMSTPKPTVASILANADKLRELKVEGHLLAHDGTVLPYKIETQSNDPAEIAAAERIAEGYRQTYTAQAASARDAVASPQRAALIEHERAAIIRALEEHRPAAQPIPNSLAPAPNAAPLPAASAAHVAPSAQPAEGATQAPPQQRLPETRPRRGGRSISRRPMG